MDAGGLPCVNQTEVITACFGTISSYGSIHIRKTCIYDYMFSIIFGYIWFVFMAMKEQPLCLSDAFLIISGQQ